MPDHHSIMQEVINSKTVLKQMGQPAAALSGKIDAISVEMQKALQLRDGYKRAQATLATLKKAADDQSKKVDDAKAKNDALHAKHLDAAKDVEERAKKVQEDSSLKGDKNKAIAQAVNRIQFLAYTRLKQKVEYFDFDFYQTQADDLTKYRQIIPKPDSSNKLPQDLGVLQGKVDALVKQFQDAATPAKAADQIRKEFVSKNKAFDDMQAKVKPIEDALTGLLGRINADLNDAKGINAALDHTGSKEAYQRAAAIFKVLNDAIADYSGADGKAADAKAWAAKP